MRGIVYISLYMDDAYCLDIKDKLDTCKKWIDSEVENSVFNIVFVKSADNIGVILTKN